MSLTTSAFSSHYVSPEWQPTAYMRGMLQALGKQEALNTREKIVCYFLEYWNSPVHQGASDDPGFGTKGYRQLSIEQAQACLEVIYHPDSPTQKVFLPDKSVTTAIIPVGSGAARVFEIIGPMIASANKIHGMNLKRCLFAGTDPDNLKIAIEIMERFELSEKGIKVSYYHQAGSDIDGLTYVSAENFVGDDEPFTVVLSPSMNVSIPLRKTSQYAGRLWIPESNYQKSIEDYNLDRFGADAPRVLAMEKLDAIAKNVFKTACIHLEKESLDLLESLNALSRREYAEDLFSKIDSDVDANVNPELSAVVQTGRIMAQVAYGRRRTPEELRHEEDELSRRVQVLADEVAQINRFASVVLR